MRSHDNFIEWYESEKQRIADELSHGSMSDASTDTSPDALALKLVTDVKAALTATQTGLLMNVVSSASGSYGTIVLRLRVQGNQRVNTLGMHAQRKSKAMLRKEMLHQRYVRVCVTMQAGNATLID